MLFPRKKTKTNAGLSSESNNVIMSKCFFTHAYSCLSINVKICLYSCLLMPGKQDVLINQDENGKRKEQKQVLTMTFGEA